MEGRGTPHKEKWKGRDYERAPADAKVCVSRAVMQRGRVEFGNFLSVYLRGFGAIGDGAPPQADTP